MSYGEILGLAIKRQSFLSFERMVLKVAEKIIRKTVSVRLAIGDWTILHNISANRDVSIQSLIEPIVRNWLKDVPEEDKAEPEEEGLDKAQTAETLRPEA